jgi:hypothetical protein
VRESIRDQSTAVAPSSHGCSTPRAYRVPGSRPVEMSEGGVPSSGTHQGACSQPAIDGSTNAASVRLQGVPEAAVGVAVGGDGVLDWKRPAASEYAFEMPPFEHPRVAGQVLLSSVDVRFGHEVQHSTAPVAPS